MSSGRRALKRFLKWAAIGVGGLVVVLAATLYFFNWNWVRGEIGQRAGVSLGRDVAIDGDVRVRYGWTSQIHVEGIRIGNPDWAKERNMLEIAVLDFSIELGELMRGRLVIPELALTRPKVALEKPDAKRKSWDMTIGTPAAAVAEATIPDERADVPIIGKLIIREGALSYVNVPSGLNLRSTISTALGSGSDSEEKIHLEASGTVQDQRLTIVADGGSLLTLRDPGKPYPLKVDIRAGSTRFFADGILQDPVQMKGLDMKLETSGNSLADIFPLTAIPLPPTPPYRLTGRLQEDKDIWTFSGFAGKVGDSDLSGDLRYDGKGERPDVQAVLVSHLLDFKDLAGFIGAGPAAEAKPGQPAPTQTAKAPEKKEERLVPDVQINLTRLRAADLDIKLVAEKIRSPDMPLQSMDSRFLLKNGVLRVEPAKFGIADGLFEGKLTLDGRTETPSLNTDLKISQLRLKKFFEGTRFESLLSGTFGGRAALEGRGKSLAEIMATSNGKFTVTMGGGAMSRLIVEAVGLNVAKILAYLPEDEPTQLRCVVLDFDAKDGVFQSTVFTIDTEASNIYGNAVLNFRDETLDIMVRGHPKKPSPLTARTPVVISGKMNSPDIGISPGELAARLSAATALGFLFPPLAIIPLIEAGLGEDSNCAGLIQQAQQSNPHPK